MDDDSANRGDVTGSRRALILRLGELFLKGRNRPAFERQLLRNVRRAVQGLGAEVIHLHGRVLVEVSAERIGEAIRRITCVFGLTSLSPATLVAPDLESITAAADAELAQALSAWPDETQPTFRVSTRRSDKSFPLKSPEISQQVGGALVASHGLPVRLRDPDLTVEVEIGRERSFVSTRRVPGAGGLPVGVSGDVSLLLSGGIDSPVAGWLLAKRGSRIHPVSFESPPYTGPAAREKVVDLCRTLARYTGPLQLRFLRLTDIQLTIGRQAPPKLAVVLYRRMMIRAAEHVARREGHEALATGESLGQVASQTLTNLAAISSVAKLPILRPLVTYDKAETIALAQRIGTYEISIRPHVDCCTLFVPDHPETHARMNQVLEAEAALGDLDAVAAQMAEEAERVEIADPFA